MNTPTQFNPRSAVALLAAALLCAGCSSLNTAATTDKAQTGTKDVTLVKSPTDLSFLLSMSFVEAKSISTQQLEFPPYIKIAADSIQVFKYSADGKPLKARARGKVFIEMNFNEPAKALCQEAFITDGEIILRGSPILQRGGSMVEGLDESTIFYIFGTSLRVIGLHKVNNQNEIAAMMPTLGTWAAGPNPLLPPLTESAVPSSIRDSMQRAAEAEMLHQKTRELYGPADAPPATPTPAQPEKESDKSKSPPPPAVTKKPIVEIRRAVPHKPSFWSRFKTDKSRA
ncbi:MAG: hypothetical protein K9N47_24820 [Prosthecobacter sp.]|uniref:hypothetical protein n=1 Tax=Prosthecobacter sp. TaxID=1965333 RepID=UPI00262C6DED|nr:hypothetical protein [Prosthecobacter sp.]MCF7789368.1 hypothetical protein [Prosthecobacter sp.]